MEFRKVISTLILIGIASLIVRLFLKRKIRTAKIIRWWILLTDKFHDHQILQVPEFNDNLQINQLFRRVSLYLNSLESLEDSDYTNLFSGPNQNDVVISLNVNQTVLDTFLGARLWWTCCVAEGDNTTRLFTLRIRKRDKRRVLRTYLQHIHVVSDEIDQKQREVRLFTTINTLPAISCWRCVPFTHPATMETIVMDAEVKNRILVDVDMFQKSESYYHRLGRVWKRSYLLYGPSGTGKSGFVAALAKKLSYDIYELDLSRVSADNELKNLLLQTTPRSVILMEDFDKYVTGKSTMSVSGILNFMDGVVNSCCDERVMVFTMTTKDDIDPAILRPGRVDVHIHFPNCDFNNFKNLASSYLGVKEHKLFPQVEEIFSSGATLSPAEIGELMMVNRNSPSRALKSVISALQTTSNTALVGGGGSGGDSCRSTPKNGSKLGPGMVDGSGESIDGGSIGRKDSVKEIKKLYGLLRRKSNVRVSDSFDSGM